MLNTTILMGRLVKDPFISENTEKESTLGRFTLAVNGAKEEDTVYIDCVAFNNKSVTYLHKGDSVAVTGRLNTRKYETKDGQTRTAFEVILSSIEFISVKSSQDKEKVAE